MILSSDAFVQLLSLTLSHRSIHPHSDFTVFIWSYSTFLEMTSHLWTLPATDLLIALLTQEIWARAICESSICSLATWKAALRRVGEFCGGLCEPGLSPPTLLATVRLFPYSLWKANHTYIYIWSILTFIQITNNIFMPFSKAVLQNHKAGHMKHMWPVFALGDVYKKQQVIRLSISRL